ncbi:MAG: AAA family ATPase [Spirochaetia bacterium]
MAPLVIYVTGFRQHAGKTVTSLGLLHLLSRRFAPEELGYIKPVGQQLMSLEDGTKVDKDALIIERFSGIPDLDMKTVSPVRLASGFTKQYISCKDRATETERLKGNILKALDSFSHKKIVIAEGTGHPGVGGIVGLSNANVGKLMHAQTLFLSGGGIGKALDMLEVDLSYFIFKGCRVRGLIFNKVFPKKIDTVKEYITEELINERYGAYGEPIRIFGFLPEISKLNHPSMRIIASAFPDARSIGTVTDREWMVPCNGIKVVSLTAEYLNPEKHIAPGDVVLLGSASKSRRIKLLSYQRALKKSSERAIGGIVLTCGETTPLDPEIEDQIAESGIPALYVQEDTAAAEEKIIEVFENTKIQVYDKLKHEKIKELFENHFDLDLFLDALDITGGRRR